MAWILLLVVLLFTLAVLYLRRRQAHDNSGDSAGYRKRDGLFSPAERSFFGVLNQAVGPGFRVFGKVRVGDVLAPEEGLTTSQRARSLNRINRLHFDFVVCAADDLSIVCAVELDDKSHQQAHRQRRDVFLTEACRTAGFTLINFPTQHAYSVPEVAATIARKTGVTPGGPGSGEHHVIATNYASSEAAPRPGRKD